MPEKSTAYDEDSSVILACKNERPACKTREYLD